MIVSLPKRYQLIYNNSFYYAFITLLDLLSFDYPTSNYWGGKRFLRFQKYLNLSFTEVLRVWTWRWADRIIIFEWTIPLMVAVETYLSKASAKFVAPITMTPSLGLNLKSSEYYNQICAISNKKKKWNVIKSDWLTHPSQRAAGWWFVASMGAWQTRFSSLLHCPVRR